MRGRGRGRGRGSGRRGGRGRSSGGRGRQRHGHGNARSRQVRHKDADNEVCKKALDVNADVKSYFVGSVSADQHYEGQEQNRDRYAAGMAVLQKNGIDVAQNARTRALTAAWLRHDYNLADAFLRNKDQFGLNEVLKALSLLDSGRQVRVLEKKVKRLQMSTGKVKPKKLGKLKSDIDNLNKNKPQHGSASGAVCKHIRKWAKKFTKDELLFYALHFPTEPWKKLADICHFHPKNDFPDLDWFLDFVHGGSAPEGSMVHRCRDVTGDNVNDLIKEFPIPVAHLTPYFRKLTDESKGRIASYETKLDTVIWWYEELRCKEADAEILRRVESGEVINLPTGKLLERLLMMKMYRENISQNDSDSCYSSDSDSDSDSDGQQDKGKKKKEKERTVDETKAPFFKQLLPLAQRKMDSISLSLESPIVVIGDASGSMQVAVRTSTIIAGILTAITSAQLCFFDEETRDAPYLPKNIEEVLQLAVDTDADNATCPAASLRPYYRNKEVVKTFIIVTDEEENRTSEGELFHELFKKYHDEVYPAKLVFVSFYCKQTDRGQMVPELEELGFKPLRFVFDLDRPDLTKLDKVFGMLASGMSSFDDEIAKMEAAIKNNGLYNVFEPVTV